LHIAYVITRSDAIGGAQLHVRDLAVTLRREGHHVSVCMGGSGVFAGDLDRHQIPFRSLHYLRRPVRPHLDVAAVVELWAYLRKLGPDLISAHSSKAGLIARLAGRLLGIPVVFTAHGWAFTEGVPEPRRTLYALLERMVAPLTAKIITVSEYDRQLAVRYGVGRPTNTVTIHNSVPDITRDLLATPGSCPPRIVMVARFEEPKDRPRLVIRLRR